MSVDRPPVTTLLARSSVPLTSPRPIASATLKIAAAFGMPSSCSIMSADNVRSPTLNSRSSRLSESRIDPAPARATSCNASSSASTCSSFVIIRRWSTISRVGMFRKSYR